MNETIKPKTATGALSAMMREAVMRAELWTVKHPDVARETSYVTLLRAAVWHHLREENAGYEMARVARRQLRRYLAELDYSYNTVVRASDAFTPADNELFARLGLPLVLAPETP